MGKDQQISLWVSEVLPHLPMARSFQGLIVGGHGDKQRWEIHRSAGDCDRFEPYKVGPLVTNWLRLATLL